MEEITLEKLLRIALIAFGAIFFTIYPAQPLLAVGLAVAQWPWPILLADVMGVYAVLGAYLIAAARNPSEHRSLISFTVSSSIVHAGIMAVQAIHDGHEIGHLVGDVPALGLVAAVLWYLSPERRLRVVSA